MAKKPMLPPVTIVIPTKNEGVGLAQIISSVKPYAGEVIVVDGHSRDNTREITLKSGAKYLLDHNRGRGDAVRLGIKTAKYDTVVLFDADGSHQASDISNFITPIQTNQADLVIGSRRLGGSFDLNMNFTGILRSGGADFLAYLVNRRFGTSLSDVLYSFRAVKKSIALQMDLRADDFTIEQEMVVKCLHSGFRIMEIPSREKARAWGQSKLKTITGIKFILVMVRDLYFYHGKNH